jgi:hypothetical protein
MSKVKSQVKGTTCQVQVAQVYVRVQVSGLNLKPALLTYT